MQNKAIKEWNESKPTFERDILWLSAVTYLHSILQNHLDQCKYPHAFRYPRTDKASVYLLLRCTAVLQGSPRNLLGFKGAVGGSLFTAISHGRIGDVV